MGTRHDRIKADNLKFKERVLSLFAKGMKQSDIARKVGVSRQRIQQIVKGV